MHRAVHRLEVVVLPLPADLAVGAALLVLTHEGAHDVDDLLDRRVRVGLVPADRTVAEPLARRALGLVEVARQTRA